VGHVGAYPGQPRQPLPESQPRLVPATSQRVGGGERGGAEEARRVRSQSRLGGEAVPRTLSKFSSSKGSRKSAHILGQLSCSKSGNYPVANREEGRESREEIQILKNRRRGCADGGRYLLRFASH
jgi:hypothetical protein